MARKKQIQGGAWRWSELSEDMQTMTQWYTGDQPGATPKGQVALIGLLVLVALAVVALEVAFFVLA